MRKIVVLACIALAACAAPGVDIRTTHRSSAAKLRGEITAANAAWVAAIRAQDLLALRGIMAPEYRLIPAAPAKPVSFETWLRNFSRMKMNDYHAAITDLNSPAPGVAVATVVGDWDSTQATGSRLRETFTLRDTWSSRGGKWVVVSREVMSLTILR